MTVKSTLIKIGELDIQLTRKDIKNLHISVMPPDGDVRVSAPKAMTDTAVRMAVIHRIPWIRRQQASFANQDRQSTRQMLSGETHYLWGRRYRLEVIEIDNGQNRPNEIKLKSGRLKLYVSPHTTTENKAKILNDYYRMRLKARVPDILDKWATRLDISVESWQIKRMKTKWGSCSVEDRRIWLNLELAKKPINCLEYIILHELVHFKERNHNTQFKAILDTYMPDWRSRRDMLNQMPLDQESWKPLK